MKYSFPGKMKKFQSQFFILLVLTVYLIPGQTIADINWRGFGSIGGGQTFSDDETFLASPITDTSYNDSVSFDADTCIGLQTDIDLNDKLAATIQIISRGGSEFDAGFEWAFLSYELTNSFSFVFGKRRMPLFMHSQNLEVGYTYHWIRPPNEVYYVSATFINGPGLVFRDTFGPLDVDVELYFGASKSVEAGASTRFGQEVTADIEELKGITVKMGLEYIKVHLTCESADTVLIGETSGIIADLNTDAYNLGVAFDAGWIFIHAEISKFKMEALANSKISGYGSLGFRIGAFTPHITYSKYKGDDDNLPLLNTENYSTTVGLRYDFHPSAAFKIEYTKVEDDSDLGIAIFSDSESISLAIDFLF